jgi:hypothetical protein
LTPCAPRTTAAEFEAGVTPASASLFLTWTLPVDNNFRSSL